VVTRSLVRGAVVLLVAGAPASLLAGCGEATAKVRVTQALPKEAGPSDAVAFVISVTNLGPGTARGVRIQEKLPAGFQYVATSTIGGNSTRTSHAEPRVGDARPAWGTWTMAAPSGRESKLIISFGAKAAPNPGNYTSELTVTTSTASTLEGETAARITIIPRAALAASVTTSTPQGFVGGSAAYTISLTNTGSAPAEGVVVTDILPGGFEFAVTQAVEGNFGRTAAVDPLSKHLSATWATFSIPPASREGPGLLRITFEARILPGTPAGLYGNTVSIWWCRSQAAPKGRDDQCDRSLHILLGDVAQVAVR
jgi:uncharacterized repeat protein (TIGR01451 family)